jgi:hypothetical protein
MQKRRLLFSILVLSICLNAPGALWAQGITESFESGIPGTWTFSGPTGLDGVDSATSGITPTHGAQFAWISTGCGSAAGTTCPTVATAAATYGSLYDGQGTNGLPSGQGLGAPTVKTTLTSPVFSLGSTDTISFDVNFVTTDGTYDFADFAVVQLVPAGGSPMNLFVANTTLAGNAAVPPVGLMNGIATQNPATAYFSGLTATFGFSTYGNVPKFGGGLGGPTGWIHVSSSAPVGNYQLVFVVAHVGDTNYPTALAIDNVQTTTTAPQPIAAGMTTTFSGGVINQKIQIPLSADMGGAAFMQVTFMQIPQPVFNATRLPATSPNTFSGGTAVPATAKCTPIANTRGNCIVMQSKCFMADGITPFDKCPVKATSATELIGLTYQYGQGLPQTSPALLIADDGQNNWANITTSFNGDCCTIKGGTSGTNMDTTIVDLTPVYNAFVQQPINSDGSSVFKANRGVVPVKFSLTQNSVDTCTLPAATILVTRISGGVLQPIDETSYLLAADNGSNFRISGCQYVYNLATSSLGVGTYEVDIIISGTLVGSGFFALK